MGRCAINRIKVNVMSGISVSLVKFNDWRPDPAPAHGTTVYVLKTLVPG
jgi:hypothetical protein